MTIEFYSTDGYLQFVVRAENDAERVLLRLFEQQTNGREFKYLKSSTKLGLDGKQDPGNDSFEFGTLPDQNFVARTMTRLRLSLDSSELKEKLTELSELVPHEDIIATLHPHCITVAWVHKGVTYSRVFTLSGASRES